MPAAAEGAFLCHYSYDDMKSKDKETPVNMSLYSAGASDCEAWERGKILAEGQNFSRWLMETPANHLTPTIFSELIKDKLGKLENVTVEIRDRDWAREKGMNSFLSVSQGSDQPPKFVEVHYKGGKAGDAPFALVGKGITFDSGGISIKSSADMDKMRADMGGAACVAASIYTAAQLKLPINVSAAAEGAFLCHYSYDDMKSKDKETPVNMSLYSAGASDCEAWERGKILAEGQNFSRWLMETPANHLTPTIFSELIKDKLGKLENVTVEIRDRDWAREKGMNSFLSVSQGSDQPPKFVEVHYKGGKAGDAPFALVGKGITFDSGGISIKSSADMDKMRADMGGAACVAASIYTAAQLKLPINVSGFMAMLENLPSGSATKPGDVFTAMNGKTIKVDNTDCEGRLVLADALCYAETFKPKGIIDMATLTEAIMIALGAASSAAFTHSKCLWETIHQAGGHSGDRIWRIPLFKHYTKNMTENTIADVNNVGTAGPIGGSSTAAAFLKEFVTIDEWMHLDIAGVMENKGEVGYMSNGMSGRPTRTIVEFLNMLSKSS